MRRGRRGAWGTWPRDRLGPVLVGQVRTTTRVIYCPPADRSGSMKPINLRIADELGVREQQVAAAISLLDGGATVPFVARYRKEATGALDDAQLRTLEERLRYLRELDERRAAILESIDQQGKLDAALKQAINAADSKARLEDLYLPYRPKRRTKAQIAREAGLEPLAEALLAKPEQYPEQLARRYVEPNKGVTDASAALEGARAILVERFTEDATLIGRLREEVWSRGRLRSRARAGKARSEADNIARRHVILRAPQTSGISRAKPLAS
jgi:protein Tex